VLAEDIKQQDVDHERTAMKQISAMIEALQSDGPHSELASKLQLFGQFVGSWDVEIINYKADGSQEVVSGEWHFGWVLEGRAIQDVWIAPKRSLRDTSGSVTGDYGATLRFYDPKIDGWRSTWIGPVKGYVLPFIARQAGDEIILEGSFESGESRKWIFSDITSESFKWRALESNDGWLTYRKVQEMSAHRKQIAA
jgi:hypothetical protein